MASPFQLSSEKKEFKFPKPIHLPRLTFLTTQTSNVCSSEKKLFPEKKIPLRPLKEVLPAADYELLIGSKLSKPIRSDSMVKQSPQPKLFKNTKSKIRKSATTDNVPDKRLKANIVDRKFKKPKKNFIEANKKIKQNIKETPKIIVRQATVTSANSKDSDRDFSVYEKLYKSYKPSPLTKLCDSLDISKLDDTIDIEADNRPEIIDKIKHLIIKEEQRHRKFVANVTNLLGKLEHSLVNKENSGKKSSKATKIATNTYYSPLRDLRQDIFYKNIAKKLDYNESIDSSKIQKAFEMYSSLKGDCNFLCTPKPDSKTTPGSMRRKSLSTRIQEQCLLLVDTPKP